MKAPGNGSEKQKPFCESVPSMVSSFLDTFVDYVVGGQFLPSQDPKHTASEPPTDRPRVKRLVAIGDIHGDLEKARKALKIAGVMNDKDHWIGGSTTVVQVGDLLDRGHQELRVIYLLEKLSREALRDGGELLVMNGNHDIINVEGDFRYVTFPGCVEFMNWAHWYQEGNAMKELCDGIKRPDLYANVPKKIPVHFRARYAALCPGGPISSRFLAHHSTVLKVGDTVFAHAGIIPSHVEYGFERINKEVKRWMLGGQGLICPSYLHGKESMVWMRYYSEIKETKCDCYLLERALYAIPGSKRMVVGHTIQHNVGINGACMNRVFRIDVGMSIGCDNAAPEVLEIKNDREVKVLDGNSERVIKREPFWKQRLPGLRSLL